MVTNPTKFRTREETSKLQTNYRCWFSFLTPYSTLLFPCNTITSHKYFWCLLFFGFYSNTRELQILPKKKNLNVQQIECKANKNTGKTIFTRTVHSATPDTKTCMEDKETSYTELNVTGLVRIFELVLTFAHLIYQSLPRKTSIDLPSKTLKADTAKLSTIEALSIVHDEFRC